MSTKGFDKNSIFEKFEFLNKIEKDIKENIELLYIFNDNQMKINIIFVTNEDEVYCNGNNANGVLGFGHATPVNEFTINQMLSNKKIIHFESSEWHTIGRTNDGKLYCWGNDRCSGNGSGNSGISRPELNKHFVGEYIDDMCCGREHTLVLPSSKGIYAWGGNNEGQIGNNSDDNVVYKPLKVDELIQEKVKKISCGWSHSMALTESGHLYSWGNNSRGQLALNNCNKNEKKPQRIQIEVEIEKISCGKDHSLILSRDGDIYVFGSNEFRELRQSTDDGKQLTPTKLIHAEKFYKIASHPHHNISAALSDDDSYYVWGKCGDEGVFSEPKETKFNSFDEIFVHYLQITYKTLGFLDGRYEKEFEKPQLLGIGSFAIVNRVFHLKKQKEYAIKIIPFKGELNEYRKKCSKEIQLMGRLRSDYVVDYERSWYENNKNIFYIQMELCYEELGKILRKIRMEFNRKLFTAMSLIEYFVYNEIFKETVEALNYLHEQVPNVIHRDLKPDNILITKGINGRFVKLADFGLSALHEREDQSHSEGKGNLKYMAPEVQIGRHYGPKADVYSLGKIANEIFNFSANISMDDKTSAEKNKTVKKLVREMTENNVDKRLSCQDILDRENSWHVTIANLKNDSNFKNIIESIEDSKIEDCFHKYFIRKKSTNEHLKSTNEKIKNLLISSGQIDKAKEVEQYGTTVFQIQVSNEVSIKVTPAKGEMKGSLIYPMIKKPRGKCIIINNVPKEVHMESYRFETIFQQLFFEVQLLNGLTAQQICDKLTNISKEESLQQHEAFIVMIISQGEDEKIFGYNACQNHNFTDFIEIKEIVNIFSEKKCMALRRKPKLFFFTCDRTKSFEEPIIKKPVITIDEMDEYRTFENLNSVDQPIEDTFICYSCTEGNNCFYDCSLGITLFGQALSHSIAQYACVESLQSIMSRTCDFMDKNVEQWERLAPEVRLQGMRRQIFFNPGIHK